MSPTAALDERFSSPGAGATPWPDALRILEQAELYWLSTVRVDGRPHVTPLIGVVADGAPYFCTGLDEQKARNLEGNPRVALTTGANSWASGVDVIVEGTARRVIEEDELRRLAGAYEAKYSSVWHFDVGDGVFLHDDGGAAAVFRIEPAKVLAFAKDPHAQTTYRFA